MKYLLDTNAVIGFVNGNPGLRRRIGQEDPAAFCVSALVTHEMYYGAFKGRQTEKNLRLIDTLSFEILDFDDTDGRRAGEIRALLANLGTPIGPYDVLIAGQALARDLTVITHNTREFLRVPGLKVEDWQT